jgi:ABC-2 type transport system permease protein
VTPPRRAWPAVVEQELRDLWIGGRGLALSVAFSVLMSVVAYLVATNRGLNFLEHRETVNLTLQVRRGGRRPPHPARGSGRA